VVFRAIPHYWSLLSGIVEGDAQARESADRPSILEFARELTDDLEFVFVRVSIAYIHV
jgi:hypothetical protein